MTSTMTNFDSGEARTMISAVSRPFHAARSACRQYIRTRRRSREVMQMTQVLNRLNDRQLSTLGLVRERLYIDLEDRYDRSLQFVDDVLALVEHHPETRAIAQDRSSETTSARESDRAAVAHAG